VGLDRKSQSLQSILIQLHAYLPIGVMNAFLSKVAPFLPVVIMFSKPFPFVGSTDFPPNPAGTFSSCSGIFSGVLGYLLPGVFGGTAREL